MDRDFHFLQDDTDECTFSQPPVIHRGKKYSKEFANIVCYRKSGQRVTNLSQKVLLGILMQRRDGSSWSKPSVNRDVVVISLSKATVVRDTDVFFQLWHLEEQILL